MYYTGFGRLQVEAENYSNVVSMPNFENRYLSFLIKHPLYPHKNFKSFSLPNHSPPITQTHPPL